MALVIFALGGIIGFFAALVATFGFGLGVTAALAIWSLSGLAFGALALLPSRRNNARAVPA